MRGGSGLEQEWEKVCNYLSDVVPSNFYQFWIKPLKVIEIKENQVVMGCPNTFIRDWIKEHFIHYLKEAWHKFRPQCAQIVLKVISDNNQSGKVKRASEKLKRGVWIQPPLPLSFPRPRFCKRFTFEEFVVGKTNAYAYSASKHLASGEIYQPLYLYSDTGLGKSHLSQAVGNFLLTNNRNLRICYLTTEEFTNEMVRALKTNYIEEFKKKYRDECDVLILENIHFLSGKEKIQTELAYTLDILLEAQRKVVFTSLTPPQKIPALKRELRSRIESGLFAFINPPDEETRFNILRKKAQKSAVKIPQKVIQHLAAKIEGDVRRLESALKNVIARSIVQKRPIDLDLADEVLSFFIETHPPLSLSMIKNTICAYYNLTPDDLISKSRKRQIAQPRKVAIYLAKNLLNMPLAEIGKHFNRHHATIISILNSAEKEIRRNAPLAKEIAFISEKIKSQISLP